MAVWYNKICGMRFSFDMLPQLFVELPFTIFRHASIPCTDPELNRDRKRLACTTPFGKGQSTTPACGLCSSSPSVLFPEVPGVLSLAYGYCIRAVLCLFYMCELLLSVAGIAFMCLLGAGGWGAFTATVGVIPLGLVLVRAFAPSLISH